MINKVIEEIQKQNDILRQIDKLTLTFIMTLTMDIQAYAKKREILANQINDLLSDHIQKFKDLT